MQLKIKKSLKGGEHLVSLESIGFTPQERKKLRKFGVPLLDLSTHSLGVHRLNQMNLLIKAQTAEEAERLVSNVRQKIKDELVKLLAQKKVSFGERVGMIYVKRRGLAFGLACFLVFLLLSAYKGVISSQQIANLGKQLFTSTSSEIDIPSDGQKVALSNDDQAVNGSSKKYQRDIRKSGSGNIYSKVTLSRMNLPSLTFTQPDFTIIADPETLVRYIDWKSDVKPSKDEESTEQFKLSFMTSGGFEGPVDLEVSGSCYLADSRLYPTHVKTLPGCATLIVSLSSQCPHQVCNTLTVVARGITPDGDLIIHEKKLVLAVREKPVYQGKVWHISPYGCDLLGNGDENSPFRAIQKGIDCAQPGDTVLAERGLYQENISIIDKDKILVASRHIFDGDESTTKSSTIEAPEGGWVVTIGRSDEITLQGFTIRNGKGNDGSPGGGIYSYNSIVNIYDNIITRNENQSGYGAGIYCYESKPHIFRNQIMQNRNLDGHGAGIYCYNSDPDIEQNIISGNRSGGGGSAIHLLEPKQARIIGNLICNNSGVSAILLYHHGPDIQYQIANNTVSQNQGDAIRYFGGSWDFESNIVSENRGYGIFTLEGSVQLAYNDVWGNVYGKDTVNYFGLAENIIKTNGNISQDPCFGNPPHGNFHLSYNSPCIDLGNPNSPGGASRIDMGALEYNHPEIVCGDVNRDGFIDFGDINFLCNYIFKRGAAPYSLETADVDCDGKADQLDLAYLYRYPYLYGSEPGINCSDRNLAASKK